MELNFVQQLQVFVQNHTIMAMAWIAVLVMTISTFYKFATSKVKIVDNVEATLLINNQDALLIDVRTEDEFKIGHIVNSVHLLPTEIKTGKTNAIDKYKEKSVVVVDSNGLSSVNLANLLVKQGFGQVYALKEGIIGWRTANLPLVKNK